MQKAQVSPEGIQANSAPSRSAFRSVVSAPACLTSRPMALPIMFSFWLCLATPWTVFATC